MSPFTCLDAIAPQLLAVGYLARALHGQNVTMAIVEIDPGAELPEHRHENEQLGSGETWQITSNTPHAVKAGDGGALVMDVFSPPRLEWSALAELDPRAASWPSGG
jgi:quercetin dioxygenase-like cupin family protein